MTYDPKGALLKWRKRVVWLEGELVRMNNDLARMAAKESEYQQQLSEAKSKVMLWERRAP